MRDTKWILSAAVAAGCFLIMGCEGDDSLPSRPRTNNPFADQKAQDNADKRALEGPSRQGPLTPTDTPSQLNKAPSDGAAEAGMPRVVTLSDEPRTDATKLFQPPSYEKDHYHGPLPHLPANPGTVPMTGATPVPGTDWSIDHSWGEVLALPEYPHRAWPETKGYYLTGEVTHNPTMFFSIQDKLPVAQNDGSYKGDFVSEAYEVPWFYVNTVALPVLMALECPFSKMTSGDSGTDVNYHAYLPDGPVVPSPTTGVLKWEYPFLNPDGSVKDKRGYPSTSLPTTTP